jgi:RNA polymerase sigma-70 factor (ECF subfamily)
MNQEIAPELYDDLRGIARDHMRRQHNSHTLQPTALVHEAYLKIADRVSAEQTNRGQLLAIAARAMRSVLVDHARRKGALKRGGKAQRVTLAGMAEEQESPLDLLALDECLTELEELDDQKCRIVELRYFAGLTVTETADALGIGMRTVEENWAMARTWLRARLG